MKLVSCGQDCTARIWDWLEGKCEKIFKFSDPITDACFYPTLNLLFVGSFDHSVKAIDLVNGEVDRSWIASRESIKCLMIHNDKLYVAGDESVIREYDLVKEVVEEGKKKKKVEVDPNVIKGYR